MTPPAPVGLAAPQVWAVLLTLALLVGWSTLERPTGRRTFFTGLLLLLGLAGLFQFLGRPRAADPGRQPLPEASSRLQGEPYFVFVSDLDSPPVEAAPPLDVSSGAGESVKLEASPAPEMKPPSSDSGASMLSSLQAPTTPQGTVVSVSGPPPLLTGATNVAVTVTPPPFPTMSPGVSPKLEAIALPAPRSSPTVVMAAGPGPLRAGAATGFGGGTLAFSAPPPARAGDAMNPAGLASSLKPLPGPTISSFSPSTFGISVRSRYFPTVVIKATGARVVFVIDRSTSMGGGRLTEVIDEALAILGRLPLGTELQVIFFDNGLCWLQPGSDAIIEPGTGQSDQAPGWIKKTPESFAQVVQAMKRVQARGSTKPVPGLLVALKLEPTDIFFLTDGDFDSRLSDKEEKELVEANTAKSRILGTLIGPWNEAPADNDVQKICNSHNGGRIKYKPE